MDDGDNLRVCASNSVDGRQLSYAKGGDNSRDPLEASITICSVA